MWKDGTIDSSVTPEPQPAAPPPSPRLQFSLRTLLLLFVVLGSSLAVFGAWGIVVFGLMVGLVIYYVQRAKLFGLWHLLLLGLVLPAIGAARQFGWYPNWPNIAALAMWLLSVGTLLTHAVRSRNRSPAPPQ